MLPSMAAVLFSDTQDGFPIYPGLALVFYFLMFIGQLFHVLWNRWISPDLNICVGILVSWLHCSLAVSFFFFLFDLICWLRPDRMCWLNSGDNIMHRSIMCRDCHLSAELLLQPLHGSSWARQRRVLRRSFSAFLYSRRHHGLNPWD